jgi:hypothetical protein
VPTSLDDRELLLLAGVLIIGGLLLIAGGLILHPPLALVRRMTR